MNDMRKWDELFGKNRPDPGPELPGSDPAIETPPAVERVTWPEDGSCSIIVLSVEVFRGSPAEADIAERAIRATMERLGKLRGDRA